MIRVTMCLGSVLGYVVDCVKQGEVDETLLEVEELNVVESIELGEENDEDKEDVEAVEIVDFTEVNEVVELVSELLIVCELVEEKLWELLIVKLLLLLDDICGFAVEVELDDEDDREDEDIDVEIDESVDNVDDEAKELSGANVSDETLECCSDELLEDRTSTMSVFDDVVLCVGDSLKLIDTEEKLCCSVCCIV